MQQATVVYLRTEFSNDETRVDIVTSKTRVSSPDQTTVNSQVGTARSHIVRPAGSFDSKSPTVRSKNRRNVSMD